MEDTGNIIVPKDLTAKMEMDFLRGEKGEKGDKGDTGEQGPVGPQGEKGERGEQGPIGEKFNFNDFTQEQLAELKGEKGDKGEQGEKGEKGDKGDIGSSNIITIGTVSKGEEAEATITGESPNQILNLTLPKGDTGETGPAGYTPRRGIDYYTAEDFQTLVDSIIDEVNSFDVTVVESLPTTNIRSKVIYFVPKFNSKQQDVYDEFIYINENWEHIGTTEIDLSDYYKKEEIDKKTQVHKANVTISKTTIVDNVEQATVITNNYEVTLPLKYQVRK